MPDHPLVSVVVPVHNGARTLGRTLESLLRQSLDDFEVIIVDDGSEDDTAKVVASFDDDRLEFMRQQNCGVSSARNTGAVRAHGEFLTFLDCDDEVDEDWLETMTAPLTSDRSRVMSTCGARKVHADGTTELLSPRNMGPAYEGLEGQFNAGTFCLRTELFAEVGGYEESLRFGENAELALRLSGSSQIRKSSVAVVRRPLVTWHVRPRRRYDESVMLHSAEYMLEQHSGALHLDRRLLADHHAIAAVNAARLGKWSLARRHCWSAARAHPTLRHGGRLVASMAPRLAERYWTREPR